MTNSNSFAKLPLHHQLFLKVRDGGGSARAPGIAELHEITVEELKAHCRQAGKELIAEKKANNQELEPYEITVINWANT